jgi:segregation and condensation protein B
MWIF